MVTRNPAFVRVAVACFGCLAVACNAIIGLHDDFRLADAMVDDDAGDVTQQPDVIVPPEAGSDANDASTSFSCVDASGNVLFLNGTNGDSIHPGAAVITQGAWNLMTSGDVPVDAITIHLDPASQSDGLWWDTSFASASSQQLTAQTYSNASRYPVTNAVAPGLSVTGDGRGCNAITGNFTVHDIALDDAGGVTSVTASFDQVCDGIGKLVGCVHFQQ